MANFDTPEDTPTSRDWNWHPDVPITIGPLFHWPPRPRIILAWLARSWLTFGTTTILLALTLIVWFFFQPVIKRCATLELDWIAQIWLRNLVLALGFISSLHLYFHIFRKEGIHHKFEKRELARKNRTFLFGNQVWDNMFWTLGSGVGFWTAWEVLYWWALANGHAPGMNFSDNPVWFFAMFLIVVVWNSGHFYFVHRWMHYPKIYPIVHALHHRNINVGPWSGYRCIRWNTCPISARLQSISSLPRTRSTSSSTC